MGDHISATSLLPRLPLSKTHSDQDSHNIDASNGYFVKSKQHHVSSIDDKCFLTFPAGKPLDEAEIKRGDAETKKVLYQSLTTDSKKDCNSNGIRTPCSSRLQAKAFDVIMHPELERSGHCCNSNQRVDDFNTRESFESHGGLEDGTSTILERSSADLQSNLFPSGMFYPVCNSTASGDSLMDSPTLSYGSFRRNTKATVESNQSETEISKDGNSNRSGLTPIPLTNSGPIVNDHSYDEIHAGHLPLTHHHLPVDHHFVSTESNCFPSNPFAKYAGRHNTFYTSQNPSSANYYNSGTQSMEPERLYSACNARSQSKYHNKTASSERSKNRPERYVRMRTTNILTVSNQERPSFLQYYHRSPRDPRFVILSSHKAFEHLKYRLPFLRSARNTCPVTISSHHGSFRHYKSSVNVDTVQQKNGAASKELTIAIRRVESAVKFFGGCPRLTDGEQKSKPIQKKSTFGRASPPQFKKKCQEDLRRRYHLNTRRMAWDAEERPPLHVTVVKSPDRVSSRMSRDEGAKNKVSNENEIEMHIATKSNYDLHDNTHTSSLEANADSAFRCRVIGLDAHDSTKPEKSGAETSNASISSASTKIKYRCKLCGQPKQNHLCTFQSRLQRSIGVMVCRAINSYAAVESGRLAPDCTETNNVVLSDHDQLHIHHHSPSSREIAEKSSDTARRGDYPRTAAATTVTPEQRCGAQDVVDFRKKTMSAYAREVDKARRASIHPFDATLTARIQANCAIFPSHKIDSPPRMIRQAGNCALPVRAKRAHANIDGGSVQLNNLSLQPIVVEKPMVSFAGCGARDDASNVCYFYGFDSPTECEDQFIEAVALRPEQFRPICQGESYSNSELYQYFPIPLPMAERKRLCDTLFCVLTQNIPDLRKECEEVLHEARMLSRREENSAEWDLAVAELLAQLTVGLHCKEGDVELEGLAKYLMRLGISC